MKKWLGFLILGAVLCGHAEEDAAPIALDKVHIHSQDTQSLLRGAKFFASTCMACHTMKYLEFDPLAAKAGITLDKMPLNIKEWWLNIVPPDLSLIARTRSPDWIYTYLHSFYKDPSRPTGYNNLVFKDTNMQNILAPLQGEQELTNEGKKYLEEKTLVPSHYYTALTLMKKGSMTPEEFDETMTDLVNFFVYAADPHRALRHRIGWWVLLFLGILFILSYLLKKLYWKNLRAHLNHSNNPKI